MLDFYLCEHNDYSNCCYCFFRDYLYACFFPSCLMSLPLSLASALARSFTLSGLNAIVCYFKNLYDRRWSKQYVLVL